MSSGSQPSLPAGSGSEPDNGPYQQADKLLSRLFQKIRRAFTGETFKTDYSDGYGGGTDMAKPPGADYETVCTTAAQAVKVQKRYADRDVQNKRRYIDLLKAMAIGSANSSNHAVFGEAITAYRDFGKKLDGFDLHYWAVEFGAIVGEVDSESNSWAVGKALVGSQQRIAKASIDGVPALTAELVTLFYGCLYSSDMDGYLTPGSIAEQRLVESLLTSSERVLDGDDPEKSPTLPSLRGALYATLARGHSIRGELDEAFDCLKKASEAFKTIEKHYYSGSLFRHAIVCSLDVYKHSEDPEHIKTAINCLTNYIEGIAKTDFEVETSDHVPHAQRANAASRNVREIEKLYERGVLRLKLGRPTDVMAMDLDELKRKVDIVKDDQKKPKVEDKLTGKALDEIELKYNRLATAVYSAGDRWPSVIEPAADCLRIYEFDPVLREDLNPKAVAQWIMDFLNARISLERQRAESDGFKDDDVLRQAQESALLKEVVFPAAKRLLEDHDYMDLGINPIFIWEKLAAHCYDFFDKSDESISSICRRKLIEFGNEYDPEDVKTWAEHSLALARVWLSVQKPDQGREALNKVIEDPRFEGLEVRTKGDIYYRLGMCAEMGGIITEAFEPYELAAELFQKCREVRGNVYQVYAKLAKLAKDIKTSYDKKLEESQKAITAVPPGEERDALLVQQEEHQAAAEHWQSKIQRYDYSAQTK